MRALQCGLDIPSYARRIVGALNDDLFAQDDRFARFNPSDRGLDDGLRGRRGVNEADALVPVADIAWVTRLQRHAVDREEPDRAAAGCEPIVRIHDLDRASASAGAVIDSDRVEEYDDVATLEVAAFERLDRIIRATLVVLAANAGQVIVSKRCGGGEVDRDIAA